MNKKEDKRPALITENEKKLALTIVDNKTLLADITKNNKK